VCARGCSSAFLEVQWRLSSSKWGKNKWGRAQGSRAQGAGHAGWGVWHRGQVCGTEGRLKTQCKVEHSGIQSPNCLSAGMIMRTA